MPKSKTVEVTSTSQFSTLLSSSNIVVADFYRDTCGPCAMIAPLYEQLSAQLSRTNKITFTKINTTRQQELKSAYGIQAVPTIMVFKNARQIETIQGVDAERLSATVKRLAEEANRMEGEEGDSENAGAGGNWLGAELPRGYEDVTSSVDFLGLEMLNWDSDKGNARTLIATGKPTAGAESKDYVQSDTDEQLLVYVPFQSTLKIHSIHITSNPPPSDDDEEPSRPKNVRLFTNKPQILNFNDAENLEPTQEIELSEDDWDPKTGTAKLELRFVKFQNVYSLVVFVAESEGDNEKVRIDRIRIIGETGEKRDGKIEKVSQDE